MGKELILITRSAYIARYLTLTHTPYRNNSQGKHTERADLVWQEVNIMQLLMRSDQDLIARKPEKFWRGQDLNLQPLEDQSVALPFELPRRRLDRISSRYITDRALRYAAILQGTNFDNPFGIQARYLTLTHTPYRNNS